MKIAVFEREGRVSRQCEDRAQVALVEVDRHFGVVQQITALPPAPEMADALAGWLQQEKVEVLLTSGIRQRVRDQLEGKGVQVVAGVPPFRVEAALASFLAGTLSTGADTCEQ